MSVCHTKSKHFYIPKVKQVIQSVKQSCSVTHYILPMGDYQVLILFIVYRALIFIKKGNKSFKHIKNEKGFYIETKNYLFNKEHFSKSVDCYAEDQLYTPQRAQITTPESFPHYLSVSKRLSMYYMYMYIVMVAR